MARRDLPPIELPIQCASQEVAVPREETASIHLSLEAEIDLFHLEEEGEVLERLVELSDSEANLYRFSVAHSPGLIVVWVDTSSEEEEGMDLKHRSSLKGLLANRKKESTSKEITKTQVPPSLPPPPPSMTIEGLLLYLDLKRRERHKKGRRGRLFLRKGRNNQRMSRTNELPLWRVGRRLVLKHAEGRAYRPLN